MKLSQILSFKPIRFILSAFNTETLNHLTGLDPWVDGNLAEFSTFSGNVGNGPVTMLHLLKFKELSLDGNATVQEQFVLYGDAVNPLIQVHGGEMVFLGAAGEHLIGDTNYDWDAVVMVKWPDRQNLLDLVNDEAYQAIGHLRTNRLERAMLIALDVQSLK